MGKRPNLAANVKAAAGEAQLTVAQFVRPAAEPAFEASSDKKRGQSRAGRKAVYAWVAPAQHKQLKRLSLDLERSIDSLVTEAVQTLLTAHQS